MDDWLANLLIRQGYMDGQTLATRAARVSRCLHCDATVVRGLDADWCARSVDADPKPLSAVGEALVLMSSGRSLELRELGGRLQLDTRDQWRIHERPAGGTWRGDVLAAHRCNRPALPAQAHCGSALSRSVVLPTADEPPF